MQAVPLYAREEIRPKQLGYGNTPKGQRGWKRGLFTCSESWYIPDRTTNCGFARDKEGEKIFDSQVCTSVK